MAEYVIKTIDKAAQSYKEIRVEHWNKVAQQLPEGIPWGPRTYYRRLKDIYKTLVAPNQRVLEIGCGGGDLLACLHPNYGVGVDFSPSMCELARVRHPEYTFVQLDACDLSNIDGPFDVIILSDTINDLWNVQVVFNQIKHLSSRNTRLILNSYSRLWEIPLSIARQLRLANPTLPQNWLTSEDVQNLLLLSDFEVVRHWQEILFPVPIPLLEGICNKFLVHLWPFRLMALTNFIVARPKHLLENVNPSISIVVPARNESGNISQIFERVSNMGPETELIFVEGHSKDDTYSVIEQHILENPQRKASLFRQEGIGKADAVRLGFEKSRGEVLMILDADLTVSPEDLPLFVDALISGKGELINGVRLVYPMQDQAMRSMNFLGNKFFSLAFSWLLGQQIKDTLCGTKVLWRKDYDRIVANRSYFGDFDPFGDFDLIFGAAKLNLRIIDLPIRYRERTYGETNINRWKHGLLLLRMVFFAAVRLKFI